MSVIALVIAPLLISDSDKSIDPQSSEASVVEVKPEIQP